jgi:hypothetical protein
MVTPDRILWTESLAAVVIAEVPIVVWSTLCVIADGAQESPVTVRVVATVAAAVCEETRCVIISKGLKDSTLSRKMYHSGLKYNS